MVERNDGILKNKMGMENWKLGETFQVEIMKNADHYFPNNVSPNQVCILRISKVFKNQNTRHWVSPISCRTSLLVFLRGKSEEEKLEEHRKSGQLEVDLRGG